MKDEDEDELTKTGTVAPYTGAWIERFTIFPSLLPGLVAPYTGAWIESVIVSASTVIIVVAPYTGAWIERKANTKT